jgi:tetratricopeptide (TPR) repeat protein
MPRSLKATQQGLDDIIDPARIQKKWNQLEEEWELAAGICTETLKRFWKRKPIARANFIAICQAVGVQDWKQIAYFLPPPPSPYLYKKETWVGRNCLITKLLDKANEKVRIVWLTGISGIGKTTLGECLACKTYEIDPSFQWISWEILDGQSPDFANGVANLLTYKMGEPELDPQECNDPKRMTERLLHKLRTNRYWLQIDALERLLDSEQPTETAFIDENWVIFLQRCLTEQNFASRLVLTAQALPSALAEFENRYPNVWQQIPLQGLSVNEQHNEHLDLFRKNGVTVNDISSVNLMRIGQIYEGHPLVLQVIAKEILDKDFQGDVAKYWQRYSNEFEQVARELQSEQMSLTLYNQALQTQVRRRVEISLKRLPQDAFDLLCRSSVFRRSVPETFWLKMIGDRMEKQQQQAYRILCDRALIEKEGIHQSQFLIRQHNLIRSVAYDLLKSDADWRSEVRKAAYLWHKAYEPAPDSSYLESILGDLEAFELYCEIEDWEVAKDIWLGQQIGLKLYKRCHWQKALNGYQQLLGRLQTCDELICLQEVGNAYCELGKYTEAKDHYTKSLILARRISNHEIEANSWMNLGNINYMRNNLVDAIEEYIISEDIHEKNNDDLGRAKSLLNLGNSYQSLKNYELAIKYHEKSLEISLRIPDGEVKVNARMNLANDYALLGNYLKAISEYRKVLSIDRKREDSRRGEGITLMNLGEVQFWRNNYKTSLCLNHAALTIFRKIKDKPHEFQVLQNLAEVYYTQRQVDEIKKCHQQVLTLQEELRIPWNEAFERLLQTLNANGKEGL